MQGSAKYLNVIDANICLNAIDMVIGDWGQIKPLSEDVKFKKINYPAPENARELLNLASHIAVWLAKGDWKLLQMDNSNHMNAYEAYLISKLLSGRDEIIDFWMKRTFFFQFGNSKELDENTEILIANLIGLLLLYSAHCQFVSSDCSSRKILSIQDGFIYFIADDNGLIEANAILEKYEENPLSPPNWVDEIVAAYQQRGIEASELRLKG